MTRGKPIAQTVLTIVFLSTICLFFFGTILSEKKAISPQEKRLLAKFPEFSVNSAALVEWPKSLSEYLKDHLYYRENLVLLNALVRVKVFERSPTFMVLAGEEGWYFYMGDWALHDFLHTPDKADDELTRSWEKLITHRQQSLHEFGANYLVAIAPNKECLYPEFLPGRIRTKAGVPILQLMSQRMRSSVNSNHFIDLTEPLQLVKSDQLLYYKTDSHWNSRGSYFAYRAIIDKVRLWHPGIVPLSDNNFDKRQIEISNKGDLVLLMGLIGAISEKDEEWDVQYPCAKSEDRTVTSETLPVGKSLVANGCSAGAPLRVLVISDSFGESMKRYISQTFQYVVYSRELNVPDLRNFITQHRFDIVLDLRVGRHLPKAMSPGQDEKI